MSVDAMMAGVRARPGVLKQRVPKDPSPPRLLQPGLRAATYGWWNSEGSITRESSTGRP